MNICDLMKFSPKKSYDKIIDLKKRNDEGIRSVQGSK